MSRASERTKELVKQLATTLARKAAWKLILWLIGLVVGLGWPVLLGFVIIAVIVNVSGSFFLGSYTGVHLSGTQQQYAQEDAHIKQVYQTAANQWEDGMDAQQQSIARSYQVYLPTSVLLTLGKFIDNYQKPNQAKRAQAYYALLAPTYTWVKGQGKTIHKYWTTVPTKNGSKRVIETSSTAFTVWELRKAVVWDGTFTSTWTTKTMGSFGPDGTGTQTTEPYMVSENMGYGHSRFYAAAKKYGFDKSTVDPLWFNAIYSMQYAEYSQQKDEFAYLLDPKVMQWGPVFGMPNVFSSPPISAGTVANPTQVKNWIDQALTLDAPYGIPSSWAPYILEIIGHEDATGDPYAVNPQAVLYTTGVYEHAEGIMQTMPSTFFEFAVPGHIDVWNPVDNIAAAVRYIQGSNYHTPLAIDGIGNNLPYQGY